MAAAVGGQGAVGVRLVEDARGGGSGGAAAGVDPHVRVGLDVAEPLGFPAEAGGDDIGVRVGMIDHLEHHIAPGAGLAADVFEHQDPRSEQGTGACAINPDGRAHEPAGAQQLCAGPG
ncbi:hypothetical protein NIIDMKKI_41480 [Mycobacterium kansasii]|uniref:Uncharacterized protein n=1 Tax=Mycobacterium kansasii TaxID=1768 RepID=A0A7G1IG74_MYCKA|nr:hypothetical protein NIIDMKKI_41480 [Mycobacterium kansasii]